jgi:hypothetical protein
LDSYLDPAEALAEYAKKNDINLDEMVSLIAAWKKRLRFETA